MEERFQFNKTSWPDHEGSHHATSFKRHDTDAAASPRLTQPTAVSLRRVMTSFRKCFNWYYDWANWRQPTASWRESNEEMHNRQVPTTSAPKTCAEHCSVARHLRSALRKRWEPAMTPLKKWSLSKPWYLFNRNTEDTFCNKNASRQ